LLEDQAYLLEQFVDLAQQEPLHAVIIAGDVYDRAVPPNQAIEVLDEVLSRLVLDLGLPVILIAGNHDSPSRLAFGSRLLVAQGLHILGHPASSTVPVVIEDEHGPVCFYPLPYAEPVIVRHYMDREDLQSHQETMKCLIESIWSRHPKGMRSVVVAHCFVAGSTECESERPLSVGGASMIKPTVFKGFNYVALGHLHRPQSCDGYFIHYSGSLMRYSFSETDHSKAVLLVEMDAEGNSQVQQIDLAPRRQVRQLQGKLADILAEARKDKSLDDYLMVRLLDEGPIFDAMGKLREVYPNVLHIERPMLLGRTGEGASRLDHRKMGDLELFAAFFEQVTGQQLNDDQEAAFVQVAEEFRRSQREALE